jgi:RNA 3'-terminal phosphate cyclase (ATP)
MKRKEPMMTTIDGGEGEGGGQILRTSFAVSALLGLPISVVNIRAGRPKPGLAAQHLTGLELVANICAAADRSDRRRLLDGAKLGSELVRFSPEACRVSPNGGHWVADTRTAGSCTLLVQIALPCIVFGGGDSEISCIGGTNVSNSPSVDEMTLVLFPLLARFGVSAQLELVRRGFYPKGQGELRLRCKPSCSLAAIELVDRGELKRLTITIGLAGRWAKLSAVATHLADELTKAFGQALPAVEIAVTQTKDAHACDDAAFVCVSTVTTTGCMLGAAEVTDKKTSWKEIASKVVPKFLRQVNSGSCLDEWVADQVLIFMALAKGTSKIKLSRAAITPHFETGVALIERLLGVQFRKTAATAHPELVVVECCGIGYANRNSDVTPTRRPPIGGSSIASKSATTEVLSKEEALRRFIARKAALGATSNANADGDALSS